MSKRETKSVKSYINTFIRTVFGKKYRIQIDTRNEVGLDLFEDAMIDVTISDNAEPLYERYGLDNSLYQRIFVRMMLGFVAGYLLAANRRGGCTLIEAIEAYYEFCGINELQYPTDNALKMWYRHAPKERLDMLLHKKQTNQNQLSF